MASLLKKIRRLWRPKATPAVPPQPVIQPQSFARTQPKLHAARKSSSTEGTSLVSQVCRHATLDSATFRGWAEQLREPWRAHRKLWELAFICQALDERGLLQPGRKGLGFAVGAEKLPSLFAARGCQITATDLPSDDERNKPWAASGQWVGNLEALNESGLCPEDAFRDHVAYRPVDMNHIPDDLGEYDFTWSTCSFEHCGNLDLGLRFLERQMACLRPGGVAVHTTEFNLSSNDATLADGPCVIYRLRDMEAICGRLAAQGHHVEPLDVDPGSHGLDQFVDQPPYADWHATPPPKVKHLRLNLAGHASTSIALVIRKAA
jgi:hypothetical protein